MKIALAICVLLAGLSARQQAYFRDDVTLWSRAVAVEPNLARPAINLAKAYRRAGRSDLAAVWIVTAGPLTRGDRREWEYRALIASEINYLEITGTPICDQSTARPYC